MEKISVNSSTVVYSGRLDNNVTWWGQNKVWVSGKVDGYLNLHMKREIPEILLSKIWKPKVHEHYNILFQSFEYIQTFIK